MGADVWCQSCMGTESLLTGKQTHLLQAQILSVLSAAKAAWLWLCHALGLQSKVDLPSGLCPAQALLPTARLLPCATSHSTNMMLILLAHAPIPNDMPATPIPVPTLTSGCMCLKVQPISHQEHVGGSQGACLHPATSSAHLRACIPAPAVGEQSQLWSSTACRSTFKPIPATSPSSQAQDVGQWCRRRHFRCRITCTPCTATPLLAKSCAHCTYPCSFFCMPGIWLVGTPASAGAAATVQVLD